MALSYDKLMAVREATEIRMRVHHSIGTTIDATLAAEMAHNAKIKTGELVRGSAADADYCQKVVNEICAAARASYEHITVDDKTIDINKYKYTIAGYDITGYDITNAVDTELYGHGCYL